MENSSFTDDFEPTSIELFAGAGGTAIGLLHKAGFKPLLLNEIDKNASATLQDNNPEWNVVNQDVHTLNCKQYEGKVDLVQGGVPCQAFSSAGHRQGFNDSKGRGQLFWEYARIIGETRPKVIMMENVKGLRSHDNGRTVTIMLDQLNKLGYEVALQIMPAQYYDVPQVRERLIIIGVRNDVRTPILYPMPLKHVITLKEALKGVPDSPCQHYSERKARLLEQIPEGGNWANLPLDQLKTYVKPETFKKLTSSRAGSSGGMLKRLSWDKPSPTIMCDPQMRLTERCHPNETRPLSIRESARIQTFPDDYKFEGSLASQYRQVGNAVPCNLAYHVGLALKQMLQISKNYNNSQTLTVDYDDRKFIEVEPIIIPENVSKQVYEENFDPNTRDFKVFIKKLCENSRILGKMATKQAENDKK